MVLQVTNAVSESNCRLLRDVFDRHAHVRMPKVGGLAYLGWSDLEGIRAARKVLRRLVNHSRTEIRWFFRNATTLQPDGAIIGKLGPGGHIRKHADNCRRDARGDWIPNHTRWREVTALYYLNSDFEGGEIVFEQHELVIKPCRGLLVAFPSDQHHLHEVLPILVGARYCVQLFFTTQRERAMTDLARSRWRSTASRVIGAIGGIRARCRSTMAARS